VGFAVAGDDNLQAGASLEGLNLGEAAACGGVYEDRYRSVVLC
jgi:hypothetical protein